MTIPRRILQAHAALPVRWRRLAGLALAAGTMLALGSCAYYNTFYTARKYYDRATLGQPYLVDPPVTPDNTNLNKSMDFSKKLMANYPRSKWVDDAYLLWARAFLAKNDPIQTADMLVDYPTRYPSSPLIAQAGFYRAVALRQARRYDEALKGFDDFIAAAPKSNLLPYAYLERTRTLRSLERDEDAAKSAGELLRRWPKSPLAVTARITRAEANLDRGAALDARQDFHFLGQRSRSDDERLQYLLRESECLEKGRQYDEALGLLRDALGHERPPDLPDTSGGKPLIVPQTPGYDRYGRLLTRIGTVQLMSGNADAALESYRRVVEDYPHTPVSAEAQYRLGYAYEIGADDFEKARVEYGKVRDEFAGSPFVAQANQRQNTLDQLARFRSASGDSSDRQAQGAFLLAEQYLFQLDKPERAVTEYGKIAEQFPGSAWAGKALNAKAWVLMRKFQKTAEAESLFWKVVREYPATEAQLAARDYLEGLGQSVPQDLIQMPTTPTEAPEPPPAPSGELPTPPPGTPALGMPTPVAPPLGPPGAREDSLRRAAMARAMFGPAPTAAHMPLAEVDSIQARQERAARAMAEGMAPPRVVNVRDSLAGRGRSSLPDSVGRRGPGGPDSLALRTLAAHDSLALRALAAHDSLAMRTLAARDSLARRGTVPGDSLGSRGAAAADSTARGAKGRAAAAAPDTVRAPLPPLELSPVVPGITFPLGPPRSFGAPELASSAGSSGPSPLLGASSGPLTPADSLRAFTARAARDSIRAARGVQPFQPRGSGIQCPSGSRGGARWRAGSRRTATPGSTIAGSRSRSPRISTRRPPGSSFSSCSPRPLRCCCPGR